MFKNIQGKLVFLYFCLVFIIMIVIGSYLISHIKTFYYEEYLTRVNIRIKGSPIVENNKAKSASDINKEVKAYLENSLIDGTNEKYYILDDLGNVVYSDDNNVKIGKVFPKVGIAVRTAMAGKVSSTNGNESLENEHINYAIPIKVKGGKQYILYIRSNLKRVNAIVDTIKGFILKATMGALILSVTLGFALAKTITSPIKDLTMKAKEIAFGKFERRIKVKSKDEIGVLTSTFNHMAAHIKKNLDEISTQKTKLETILKNLADGVIAFDVDGEIVHFNQIAKSMIRQIDRNVWELDFQKLFESMSIDIEFDQVFELQREDKIVKLWQNNDSVIKVYISPFKDDYGHIFGAVVVFQDITEQYRLDNMRKEFVANVSHELRTPITTIKSYSETLLDGAIEDKEVATEFLGTINAETDRMTRLINDLLELSRFDYKYAKLVMKSFDINFMVKNSVSKLEKLAYDKGQKLQLDLPEDELIINGDRDRLEQVVINVLSNSIKYTRENGTIKVSLKAIKMDGFQDKIMIEIKDNGMGIPKDDLERIFERFYRVDKARSRAMGGTGLGLSIVKEIVDAHGGKIEIDSEVGKGTEMRIIIPNIY
jgi:two-component system sensor histidine kinase VicK